MSPDHEAPADRRLLADGLRITCAVAAILIERHLGRAAALKANQVLLFNRHRGTGYTQPHAQISECIDEPRVRRALLLMEQNLTQWLPMGSAATELGISVRQLERLCRRHFDVEPAAQYRQMRMRFAHWLIESTARPVIEIATEAGFNDGAHFCRQSKENYGLSPSHHRRKAHGTSVTHRLLTRKCD